jgi:hypothetical protein
MRAQGNGFSILVEAALTQIVCCLLNGRANCGRTRPWIAPVARGSVQYSEKLRTTAAVIELGVLWNVDELRCGVYRLHYIPANNPELRPTPDYHVLPIGRIIRVIPYHNDTLPAGIVCAHHGGTEHATVIPSFQKPFIDSKCDLSR